MLRTVGQWLARYLSEPRDVDLHPAASPPELVKAALPRGDAPLVEGTSRFSTASKYVTQPTRSHATLYVGNALDPRGFVGEPRVLAEGDVGHGVDPVPYSLYAGDHTPVYHAVGLEAHDVDRVCHYMVSRAGYQ